MQVIISVEDHNKIFHVIKGPSTFVIFCRTFYTLYTTERIRYFPIGCFCDIIHENAPNFVDNAQYNGASKRECNVDYSAVKPLQ